MSPGIIQLPQAKTRSTPWTTTLCESRLLDRLLRAGPAPGPPPTSHPTTHGITGKGKTIVIVDSLGPRRSRTTCPYSTSSSATRTRHPQDHSPAGPVTTEDPGWAGETTLDIEYALSAPGANILVVETPDAETEGVTGFPNIVKSEQYVIDHHLGDVITQSFGATKETTTSYPQLAPLRPAYLDAFAHGITVLASTGDDGATNTTLDGSSSPPPRSPAGHHPIRCGHSRRRHPDPGERRRQLLAGRLERHLRRAAAAGLHWHQRA